MHTPGPWTVFTSPDGETLIGIGEATGEGVFDCGFGVWRSGKEKMANARLIAAAPDLYEVCRRTVDEFRAQQDDADAALAQHIAEHPVSLVSLAFAALQRVSPQADATQAQTEES